MLTNSTHPPLQYRSYSLQANRARFRAGLAMPPSRSPRSRVLLLLPHRFRPSKPSQRINPVTALR